MTEGQNSENMSDKPISGTQDRPSLSRIQVITGCTFMQAKELMKYLEAWNQRYESTCKYEIDQVPEGGPVYATCTSCGWQTDTDYIPIPNGFNYCPNCGARVIEE